MEKPSLYKNMGQKKMAKKVEDIVPALKGLTASLGMRTIHTHTEEGLNMYKNNFQVSAN